MAEAVTQEFATLITNAVSLVSALAWSEAMKTILQNNTMFQGNRYIGPIVYAICVTLLAFVVSRTLGKKAKPACTSICPPKPTPTPETRRPEWHVDDTLT